MLPSYQLLSACGGSRRTLWRPVQLSIHAFRIRISNLKSVPPGRASYAMRAESRDLVLDMLGGLV